MASRMPFAWTSPRRKEFSLFRYCRNEFLCHSKKAINEKDTFGGSDFFF